jgi:hypothetical protein
MYAYGIKKLTNQQDFLRSGLVCQSLNCSGLIRGYLNTNNALNISFFFLMIFIDWMEHMVTSLSKI